MGYPSLPGGNLVPHLRHEPVQSEVETLDNVVGTKRLRMKLPIIRIEWEEEPFEWTYPYAFGIVRHYSKGPLNEMRVLVNLDVRSEGGTHVTYQTWITTSNIFAQIGVPFVTGVIAWNRFERICRLCDRIAKRGSKVIESARPRGLISGGRARFRSQNEAVIHQGTSPELVNRLEEYLNQADELSIQRIRPYALSDSWKVNRRALLEMLAGWIFR